MNIFLRRIPANTKHEEIAEFVSPALDRGFFRKPGRIINIEILTLKDIQLGSVEYHGLVTLDSEFSVLMAIKGLKNRRLNGRYVLVRQYYHRSWRNDPRQLQTAANNGQFIEKRHGERRRGRHLEAIKNVSDQFNSEDELLHSIADQQYQATFIVNSEVEIAVAECIVSFEQELAKSDQISLDSRDDHRITRFLTEQEGPNGKTRRFQIYATKPVISDLIDSLNHKFSSKDIHYWVMPVIEYGVI
jgi:hypothetical protein